MKPWEEIRASVDIVKVVGDYVRLRKAGTNFVGLCPFHQEKTPSFSVHPARQIFHCFGCGVGGDVFKFVMLIENVAFPEALERLAEKAGVKLPDRAGFHHDDSHARERAELYRIHEVAAQFFAVQLSGGAEGRAARAYLTDRGLDERTLAQFRIGYAPSQGTALARALSEAGFAAALIEKSGLVVPGREGAGFLDRFRRRVIFPIVQESGKVAAFAGRALGDEEPKYLNSPETPIYTKSRILYHLHEAGPSIRQLDAAILVEGYMDCIALASAGIQSVVASCGTSLTETQVRLLGRYTRRVTVNYDPDTAGIAATERSLSLLLEEGFEINVLTLPDGLDPDAFIRRSGAGAYRERLEQAPAYLDYLADRAAEKHGLRTPEGKVRAVNAVLPYLAKVPNAILRTQLASRLAERLRVEDVLLRNELNKSVQSRTGEVPVQRAPGTGRVTPSEPELLKAFLDDAGLRTEFLPAVLEQGLCEGLATEPIFRKLLEEHRLEGGVNLDRFIASLTAEESRVVFELQFRRETTIDRQSVRQCVEALKQQWQGKKKLASLQAAIKRAESEGNSEELARLLKLKPNLIKDLGASPS